MMSILYKLLKSISILSLFVITANSYAAPPRWVFRADSRPPSEIFKNGFKSYGSNDDIIAHVSGRTGATGSRDSAFIPTTVDHNYVYNYADSRLLSGDVPSEHYYIYRIRATNDFYSASISVEDLISRAETSLPEDLRVLMAIESEYVVPREIPPQLIESVEDMYLVQGDVNVDTEINADFVEEVTYANEGPFISPTLRPINFTPSLYTTESIVGANFIPESDDEASHAPVYCLAALFSPLGLGNT